LPSVLWDDKPIPIVYYRVLSQIHLLLALSHSMHIDFGAVLGSNGEWARIEECTENARNELVRSVISGRRGYKFTRPLGSH
jgi:hypothetical protein